MNNISLPTKIGVLLFFAIVIVLTIGYISYRSMQAIVSSIHIEAKPDQTLLSLKNISLELEKAENSIRIYSLSKTKRSLENYYSALREIDEEITALQTSTQNVKFLASLDTLSSLINQKRYIWSDILQINQEDVIADKLRSLSDTLLKQDTINLSQKISDTLKPRQKSPPTVEKIQDEKEEPGFFQRLFGKKTVEADKPEETTGDDVAMDEILAEDNNADTLDTLKTAAYSQINPKEIAEMLSEVGDEDEKINYRIRREELRLAETNRKLTEKFYLLLQELESMQQHAMQRKAKNADNLAKKTYLWLSLFSGAVTLLAIIVIFTVANYIRKSIAYQNALKQSKREAEKLARTKEIFTANVSHEIRTPLNAIYGFLKQIDNTVIDPSNREKINIVRSSSENLLRIVNDVLDFSKLEAGKIELERHAYELRELLEEARLLFTPEAEKNKSTLAVQIADSVAPVYLGDPYRLKQVIYNLLSNAIKFTRNGSVKLTAKQVKITARKQDLVLIISDTGIGISPEKKELIFDDFTQAEAGTTQRYGGTGLGLSIVKKIVQLFGGTIELESKLNAGSKFIVRIPVQTGTREQLPAPKIELPSQDKDSLPNFEGFKALIADDEEYNRKLLRLMLDKWKLPYDEASDGLEAVEFFKSNTYSIALLDIRMPALDGIKTARFVRETLKKKKSVLPLVAITAATSEQEKKQYFAQGFNEVIGKPFNEKELLDSLHRLLKDKSPDKKSETKVKAPTPAEGLIDFEALIKISNNDTKFVREMLELFLKSFRNGLEEMEKDLELKNYENLCETAHKIASPCRHLGAVKLLTVTKDIEKKSNNNGQSQELPALVNALKTEFKSVENQIIDKLAEL